MDKPGDSHEDEQPRPKHDLETGRQMVESAFADDEEQRRKVSAVFYRALGDLTLFCVEHQDMCDHHVVDLRDAILSRVGALAYRIASGVKLYGEAREYGIHEPVEVIERIYQSWQELTLLFGCREPQERIEWQMTEVLVEVDEEEE